MNTFSRIPIVENWLQRIESDLAAIVLPIVSTQDDLSDLEVLVLLLEDRRFFQHRGVDVLSLARELFRIITLQRFGGASTIDMQFVRTRTGYKSRTMRRKLYEMLLAFLLQSRMNKIEILRAYLQEVYLGSHLYGIENASQALFRKPRYDLTLDEAAMLAAMMVYPRPQSPSPRWKERVNRRVAYGLRLFDRYADRYKRFRE